MLLLVVLLPMFIGRRRLCVMLLGFPIGDKFSMVINCLFVCEAGLCVCVPECVSFDVNCWHDV